MKSLQQVGTEILTGHPEKLYIFTGPEYGIKSAYIDTLKKHYGEYKEIPKVSDMIALMSVKHLIPLQPCLYIVRYDEEFISALNEASAKQLKELKTVGTLVCLYSEAKSASKLEKYLDDVTTSVDAVAPQFIYKYLHRDYPSLPDELLKSTIQHSVDYNQANQWCKSLSLLSTDELYQAMAVGVEDLFGVDTSSSDAAFRSAIASRNFAVCMQCLEDMPQLDSAIYSILSTMIELEKLLLNKYTSSPLREYASRWTVHDVANMFEHAFQEIVQLRSGTGDPYNSVVYLLALSQFSHVPEWEATI